MEENKLNINSIESVYQENFNLISNLDLQTCFSYVNNITEIYTKQISLIQNIYNQKEKELFKTYMKIVLFRLFGCTQKQYLDVLMSKITLNSKEEELRLFSETFSDYSLELQRRMLNTFNIYFEIVMENGNLVQIKDVYAMYQTMMTYMMCLIPENVRKILLKKDFKNIEEVINRFKYDGSLEGLSFETYYDRKIEKFICDKIQKDYDINLFDYESKGYTRKRG